MLEKGSLRKALEASVASRGAAGVSPIVEPGCAVALLESADFDVEVPHRTVCCGLTWISTGRLKIAKRVLRRALTALRPALRTSTPVVMLEPSCAAVFGSGWPELLYGGGGPHRGASSAELESAVLIAFLSVSRIW
jgi:hypothetical protein